MEGFSPPRIVHVAETGSTNADAARLGLAGEALPLWVVADTQTGGRGRAGRQWVSQPGNLHASLAFRSMAPMAQAGQLSLIAGIAIIDAVRTTMDLAPETELRLKWPNDILIGFAKAGGILVESTSFREGSGFLAVLGFGLNLVTFPEAVGRNAVALADYGAPPSPRALIANLSERVGFWLDRWAEGANFSVLRQAWMDRAGPVGEPIVVNTEAGPLAATYEGLAETGALLANVDGVIREINYGDVALIGEIARDGDT
ncbi:biotin--[acetyl-CoA-carboxylase] ligase [Hyphomicrobium sp.]|uniref:biotin--[acetyl-CoA-carboxylase] ligase n=1 Tax=Hyphomicrobium sp. TaxID=82 RepID=UPI000F96770A|nr:biotin--[acetyl-CoA-carboxylase] ligase [Hyphomicrobium sp.]RUO97799.1 MAG: biotin--[acetyl-CoA-carboxylase] ligase [Hyphomicrobium sp.]